MFGSGFNAHEKALLKQQAIAFEATGISKAAAKKAAKEMLKEAIAESKESGYYDAGPIGEEVLECFKTDPSRKALYEAKKADGVTDEDIVEWWNIDDVERHLMLNYDDRWRIGLLLEAMDRGKTMEEAGRHVWKASVVIGNPLDGMNFPDDPSSVPLPPELKLRVTRWQELVASQGKLEETKAELDGFTTMNGYIRHLIRGGRL